MLALYCSGSETDGIGERLMGLSGMQKTQSAACGRGLCSSDRYLASKLSAFSGLSEKGQSTSLLSTDIVSLVVLSRQREGED